MWKILGLFLLVATPALARQQVTAYEALRAVGNQFGRDSLNRVISVSGVDGDPQPETWKILLESGRGGVRQLEVTNGRIASERTPNQDVIGTTQGATINTTRLNLDSSGAFAVASHTADKSNTRFASASYTLRTDERGFPVWIVTLLNEGSRPVGTIYIGANKGNVTRTEGMFAGTRMEDVVDERDVNRGEDEGPIRRRIRGMFDRAQDEARGMFDRSKQSFIDFLNRI